MKKYIELNNEVTQMGKDGFYQLAKDKEAVNEFLKEINEKTLKFDSIEDRFKFLIASNYYYNAFEQYTLEEIKDVYEVVAKIPFSFQSFMAISKFYKDYALKTDDSATNDKSFNYLESYQDRAVIVALYISKGDVNKAKDLAEAIVEQRYQPATPTFLNAGKARRGEMVSCFLDEFDDTLNSIGKLVDQSMQLSKIGGGVALNLSKLRMRGDAIKGVKGAASGVVPIMKMLEDAFSYANQLGQRKGAGATYLNIFHGDLIEFLDTKKINADEKSRIQSLSIGLIIPSKFFEIAEKNEPFYVFSPLSVFKEYGIHLDDFDIDNRYEELVNNPNVEKELCEINARDLLVRIASIQLESGYPYLMFKTNANKQHALKDIGTVKMSNLCTEIFQLSEHSIINDDDEEDDIRMGISCNLGSLNIVNVMASGKIRESVHTGMEALTAVSDMTDIKNARSIKKANRLLHSVGLGAMNLHGYLAINKIPYESEDAKDFAKVFFMMLNFYSIEKSMMIAVEKGETFDQFEKSDYASGVYFDKYVDESTYRFLPSSEKVAKLFEGIHIPTAEDWKELKAKVQENGLYNAYRLAIAPTQSISYVQNSTSSIMPIVQKIENRTYANATTYYPMPFLSKDTMWMYKSAYDMSQFKIIDLVAEIQEHVDQGISAILYVDDTVATSDLARYYIYAHRKGLKSLYYTRTRKSSLAECESCAV